MPQSPMTERRWQELAWLVGLTLLLVATGIGLRDPWPSDEPRFAMMARDMLATGQWLFPMRGIELYADKPPVFMWLQALAIGAAGSVRAGFLLPALFSSIGMVLLLHDLMRRLWTDRIARLSVLFMLMVPQFVLISRSGQIDPVVSFWITLGFYGLCRHVLVAASPGWVTVGFVAMGIGVITKGVGFLPVLALPIIAVAYWTGWRYLSVTQTRWWQWLLWLLCLLLPILAWLLPMLWTVAQSGDPAFEAYRDNILFSQTVDRYQASGGGHIEPFGYYLTHVIPVMWVTLILVLPWVIRPLWTAISDRDSRILLPLGWVILVILFFSLSPGKRGVYLMPLIPALAMVIGPMLPQVLASQRFQWVCFSLSLVGSLLLLAASVLLYTTEADRAAAIMADYGVQIAWIPAVAGLAGLLGCMWARPKRGVGSLMALMSALWLTYGLILYPLANGARSGVDLMTQVETLLDQDTELGLVEWKEQLRLQARRPVVDFGVTRPAHEQMNDAREWLSQSAQTRQLLVQRERVVHCLRPGAGRLVDHVHRADWVLVNLTGLIRSCAPAPTPDLSSGSVND